MKKKLSTQQKKAKLRRRADRLYQEIGREMYEDSGCIVPGCNEPYSCLHHFFIKASCSALRYNIKNGIPICAKHHLRLHSSDDPTIPTAILKVKGMDWYDELATIKRNTFVKTSLEYYENIINNLSNINLKNNNGQ